MQVCLKTTFQYILPFVVASAKGHGFWHVIQGDIIQPEGTDYGQHSLPKMVCGDSFWRGALHCVTEPINVAS